MRSPSSGRRATLLIAGAALTLGLSGCKGLCTGVEFFDAFFCRFNEAPHVVLKASPNPVVTGGTVTLDAAGSSDDGQITAYKWSTFDSYNDSLDTVERVTRTVDVPNGGTIKPSVTLTDDELAEGTGSVDLVVVATGRTSCRSPRSSVEENPPLSGRVTHFEGRWIDDGRIVRAEWDIDGLAGFEVDEKVPRGDTLQRGALHVRGTRPVQRLLPRHRRPRRTGHRAAPTSTSFRGPGAERMCSRSRRPRVLPGRQHNHARRPRLLDDVGDDGVPVRQGR